MMLNSDFLIRHATLRQLQILVKVSYSQSYTRAAESLHLSQPTVSIQISKLGKAVGMPLFDCIGKRLYLTIAGEKVLKAAEEILDRLVHLSDEIIELKGEVKGALRIASVTNSKYFMPRLLGVFLQTYPEVKPLLKVTNRSRVLERINFNEDELFIIGQVPESLDLTIFPFLENNLVVVANPEHPLAKKKNISLEVLNKQRLLMREHGSGTRLGVDELMQKHHLEVDPYMELGSSEAIKQGVMAGLGLSVLSLNNIELEINNGLLVVLPVAHFPLKRYWNIVHHKNITLSLVARSFLDFVLEKGNDILNVPEKHNKPSFS